MLLRRATGILTDPVVSAAVAFLPGGNHVATVTAGVKPILVGAIRALLGDMASRPGSAREQDRIGVAANYALLRIRERLGSEDVAHERPFFESVGDHRFAAAETLEPYC